MRVSNGSRSAAGRALHSEARPEALLEPSFAEGSTLVETAALAFEDGDDADDASVTVAVRLNPGDE